MEITWLGHSCFIIKSSHLKIVTDPFSPELGYPMAKPSANILTISHEHPDHSYVEGVTGNPHILRGPGEYEIGDCFITGIATYHDSEKGKIRGKNTVYHYEADDLALCHLGDLCHTLSATQVEQIGKVDILFLPVGGETTLDASTAAEVVRQLDPRVIIPMHYKTADAQKEMETVDRFLKEMGAANLIPQPKLNFTKNTLPPTSQVFLCSYRS